MRKLLSLLPLVLVIAGCTGGASNRSSRAFDGKYPIKVVATTGMVADLVRNVGGDKVQVEALMGPGTDPHLYKASPGDISKINAADVVAYSGLHLEGKMAEVLEQIGKKKPSVAVTETIDEGKLLGWTGGTTHDPHLWFDVELWSGCITAIANTLSSFDPAGKADYEKNAEAYRQRLLKLHQEIKTLMASIPKQQRVMITAHDAFRYFGRAYDVEVRGVQGISTESEAGLREINSLVDLMVKRKVKAVFVETSVSAKNVQALIEGVRRKGLNATVGGQLFSDAMGKQGTPEGTYEGMVMHNAKTIANALGGRA